MWMALCVLEAAVMLTMVAYNYGRGKQAAVEMEREERNRAAGAVDRMREGLNFTIAAQEWTDCWGTIGTNAGVRRLLEPIDDLCQDFGISNVMVAHPVSGGKLQGSMGFAQAARLVYRVAIDPGNPTVPSALAAWMDAGYGTTTIGAGEPLITT